MKKNISVAEKLPLISIIVPVYNLQDYVETAIRSALAQTYSNIEIVVVNDGSKDDTLKILRALEAEDSRLVIIDKDNEGVVVARQKGIERASGRYLTFLDADDSMHTEIVERLYNALENDKYDISCCNYYKIRNDEKWAVEISIGGKSELHWLEFVEYMASFRLWGAFWGKLYKRELFDDLIMVNAFRQGEDAFVNMQIGMKSPKVYFIDYVGYDYMMRSGSAHGWRFSLEYYKLYTDSVKKIMDDNSDKLEGKAELFTLLNRVRWFLEYIKRTKNKYIGDPQEVREINILVGKYKKELSKHFTPADFFMIKVYKNRYLKPLVLVVARAKKFKKSFKRISKCNVNSIL